MKLIPLAAAALLLVGCGATPEPAPTPTATESPFTERTASGGEDFTAEAQGWSDAGAQFITGAVTKEPGRYSISTSIADPRGADGSAEGSAAIEICESVREHRPDAIYIRVDERDGSAFVLYAPGTKVGGKTFEECGEV